MYVRIALIVLLPLLAGCANAPSPRPTAPAADEAKLIAANPAKTDPLRPEDALLDATAAGDRVLGALVRYAQVRGLEVQPLRATLERFRADLVQHLRRETIKSVWLDVPGQDGRAWERFEIALVYRRGLASYRVNDKAIGELADLPKLPSNLRKTEVWYLSEDTTSTTPARELHPAAQKIRLGRVFEAGKIAGDASAWVTVEAVQN